MQSSIFSVICSIQHIFTKVHWLRQSISSTRIASHLAVHGFVQMLERIKNDKVGVAYHMFIDRSYIHYTICLDDCASFVFTTIYKLLWLVVLHKQNSWVFIPVCDVYECLVCFLLVSGLGDTEGSLYWIFTTTLTHSPVHCLSQTSSPSSSTTFTPLRPLNNPILPLTSLTTDFITLVCCCVDPRLLASNLLLALCFHL